MQSVCFVLKMCKLVVQSTVPVPCCCLTTLIEMFSFSVFMQGLLMKSEDRLVAFMAFKMLTAVLPASKKVHLTPLFQEVG